MMILRENMLSEQLLSLKYNQFVLWRTLHEITLHEINISCTTQDENKNILLFIALAKASIKSEVEISCPSETKNISPAASG